MSCRHVFASWLLMGNHHGNRCHVISSRSPGSRPCLFFLFFHSLTEKGREEKDEREGKMRKEDVSEKHVAGRFRITVESQVLALTDWSLECRCLPPATDVAYSRLFLGALSQYYINLEL